MVYLYVNNLFKWAIMETIQAKTVKTTLNLDASVKQRIEALAKKKLIKNQTEFINASLHKSLEDMEKQASLQRLKQKLHNIKGYKSDVSILEARDQVRAESLD